MKINFKLTTKLVLLLVTSIISQKAIATHVLSIDEKERNAKSEHDGYKDQSVCQETYTKQSQPQFREEILLNLRPGEQDFESVFLQDTKPLYRRQEDKEALSKLWDSNMPAERLIDIGQLYYSGKIVTQNYLRAAKWFYKAIAQDCSAEAKYLLGTMYKSGLGVPKNDNYALKWFINVLQQEHLDSNTRLLSYHEIAMMVEKKGQLQ